MAHGRAQPGRPQAPAGSRGTGWRGARAVSGRRFPDDATTNDERRKGFVIGRSSISRPSRPRLRRHRRHHLLHQHQQPERDDRRRPAGQEGGRARPAGQAMGQDQPGARLQGGHPLSGRGRPDPLPGGARLLHGRLRLHHLHRQQRPAARRGRGGDRGNAICGGRGALGQPQLRGPHPSAGAGPTTWPARRWWWPTPWPARSTST